MSTVSAMQSAGHDKPYGTGSIVPALATNARTGHPQFRNGKREHGRLGHPPTITTANGSNNIAQSRYAYDAHGNLLTAYKWTGSSWLSNTTPNSYNSNGIPSATYNLANNQTSYAYNGTGGCNNVFPTSVTSGGLTVYYTWNCTGGSLVTQSNLNNSAVATTYGYVNSSGTADPFWRVNSITDPLGNEVWKIYPPVSGWPAGDVETASTFAFGSSTDTTYKVTDGYGRLIETQHQQSPTNGTSYDTVSQTYGWWTNYRSVFKSLPCFAAANGTCNTGLTTLFDSLGRPYTATDSGTGVMTNTYAQNDVLSVLGPPPSGENLKQVQKEYDGFGRLTKSCAIGNGSTTPCGQNSGSANGVTTSYSYTYAAGSSKTTTTRGAQTRSKTYDAVGRVTQKSTPEAGIWNYYYDSSYSSCPSGYTGAAGQLEAVLDPNGNKLCYAYDSLSRLTGVNVNGAGCLHFYYDNSTGYSGSIPSGVSTPTNPYGRMVEAVTDSCSSGTIATDEWFSYDIDGHMTDMWEKTPNSGTYYHSVATFAGNGVPLTVQLANPSLYTMTYGLDGEGRPSTLKGNSTTIVSGTTFNASSQPTYIDLGTGTDQSDYVYDTNTGRMTNWTFQVGSTGSETGTLTWNPNGTLKALAINDGFNAGGTQTCNFNPSLATGTGYDDIGRLVGIDCGSGGWGQTFSYDEYDNLTKNVISGRTGVTWAPGYNAANNHYSSGASYDANGNTLTDAQGRSFTWDFENRLIQTVVPGTNGGTTTVKYDPFGRRIEKSGPLGTTNYLYDGANVIEEMDNGGNVLARYTQGPVADEQLSELRSGTTSYYDADGLGSITSLSNGAGTLANTYTYDSYGKLIASSGTLSNPFQYTGREFDSETGIYEYRARYFDPNVGRFISQDPIGFKGGINFYAYVGNNPINLFDPTGLAAQCKHCKIVVKCRGVQKYHLGLLGFQHCDAQVVDDNGITHSLSGGPDPATNGELLNFWNTTTNLPPFGGTTIYNNQNASCDTANCLVNGANSFHNDPMHFAYIPYGGPNSNTALGGIFGGCGIHLNIDWTGPTGPGFSTMTPQ